MRPSLVRLSALRLPSFRGGAFLSVACSKARAQRRVARTDLLYPPPRHDSGGGGPRSCAVEGASDSSLRFRRRRIVESDAPTAARTRGTSPVFTGEDEDGRLTRRFAFVAGESSSSTPLPPRFRLRAPRFGGLKPAVARRASEGGSRGTSPVSTGEDKDGRSPSPTFVGADEELSIRHAAGSAAWRCRKIRRDRRRAATCVTWASAARSAASRDCRSGSHGAACGSVCIWPGTMAIESSPTVACARRLPHHRSIAAEPSSSISSIGMRLEPGSGAASSISSAPNGNGSVASAVRTFAENSSKGQDTDQNKTHYRLRCEGQRNGAATGGPKTLSRSRFRRSSVRQIAAMPGKNR